MDKTDQTTNDIINGIIKNKNKIIIKEHMGQVSFRNEIIIESHFDSTNDVVQESIQDDAVDKVKKTKYSPDKKGLIMKIIQKHNYDAFVIDILTATDKEAMKKAVTGYKSVRGNQAFKNLILTNRPNFFTELA